MKREWDAERAVVGATVAIDHGAPWGGLKLYRIERVTRTQAHITGRVLDRATGRIRGGSQWGPFGAFMPTTEDLNEANRQDLAERMRATNWRKLDYQTLRAIDAILSHPPTEEAKP